jgi:hypothetical protein
MPRFISLHHVFRFSFSSQVSAAIKGARATAVLDKPNFFLVPLS